jgi:hypothetical protein
MIEGEGSRWAQELISSKETEDDWELVDKILPKFKENELAEKFEGISNISENQSLSKNEFSHIQEEISVDKNNIIEVPQKKRADSSNSKKNRIKRREPIQPQSHFFNNFQRSKGIKGSSVSSVQSLPPIKYSKSKEIGSEDSDKINITKSKKVNYNLNYQKITEMHEEEVKIPEPKMKKRKSRNFSSPLKFKTRKRNNSNKSEKSIKTIKSLKGFKKFKISQNLKGYLEGKIKKSSKSKSPKSLNPRKKSKKTLKSMTNFRENSSPIHLQDMPKSKLKDYILRKSEMLSHTDKIKCFKHKKNNKSKKDIEEDEIFQPKNYFKIDLRVFEEELKENDPENIFRIEKMKIEEEYEDHKKHSPKLSQKSYYHNHNLSPSKNGQSSNNTNIIKLSKSENQFSTKEKSKNFKSERQGQKTKIIFSTHENSNK